MKAIVLAAGKGTRLGGLTKEIPKPMLPLNGKPLLEHIINHLKLNGFEEIGINIFTMADKIVDYFGDGEKLGVKITYLYESQLMGTAGSLLAFEPWLSGDDNFLVVYGDIITDQPLAPLLKLQNTKKAFATLLLHTRKISNSFIELDSESRVIDFRERPEKAELDELKKQYPEGFLVNSAVQVLNRKVINYIKKNNCFDLPEDVYSQVLSKERIYGYILRGHRIAIDSQERYQQALKMIKQ